MSYKKNNRPLEGAVKVVIHSDNGTLNSDQREVIITGKPARSLKCLYEYQRTYGTGLTRMKAVEHFNILCLTQHVDTLRDDFGLDIFTEIIPPERYGRYHLLSDISFPIQEMGDL